MMNEISGNDDVLIKEQVTPSNENIDDEIYSDSSDEDDPVPSNYMFPPFFVLILWGLFADMKLVRVRKMVVDLRNDKQIEITNRMNHLMIPWQFSFFPLIDV